MTKQLPFVLFFSFLFLVLATAMAQPTVKIRKADLRKDILVRTDSGNVVLRRTEGGALH
jgi:hypothetical protein